MDGKSAGNSDTSSFGVSIANWSQYSNIIECQIVNAETMAKLTILKKWSNWLLKPKCSEWHLSRIICPGNLNQIANFQSSSHKRFPSQPISMKIVPSLFTVINFWILHLWSCQRKKEALRRSMRERQASQCILKTKLKFKFHSQNTN